MQYRHRIPGPPLDSHIELMWVYQNDPEPLGLERMATATRESSIAKA
jgi:hypothetical protein